MQKSVALHTLGCKLNYSETTAIGRLLEANGYEQKDFADVASLYVINTCSVTDNADKECRQLVRRIQKKAPEALVVITGCYAQLKPEEIAGIPGVNLVLGAAEKFNIIKHLEQLAPNEAGKICSCDVADINEFIPSHSINERTRVFLKVQDGCDYNCSFCTIPLARGKSRSNTIEKVVDDVMLLASNGVKEIVLTGINLGDFGKGFSGGKSREENFLMLIQALDKIEGISRYRISSIEPNLLSEEIIHFVANSRAFMPHFHIPLQSGNNEILGAMKRRYKRELYAEKVLLIKELIPHCSIGVDVIVGFPGETTERFQDTFEFLDRLPVSYFHVFTYSERANTHALSIKPIVPKDIRHQRNKILRELSYRKSTAFATAHAGETRPVLFEHKKESGLTEGYSDNYIKVQAFCGDNLQNNLVDWVL